MDHAGQFTTFLCQVFQCLPLLWHHPDVFLNTEIPAVCHQLCYQEEIEDHSPDAICPHGQLLGAQWAELLQSVYLPLTTAFLAAVRILLGMRMLETNLVQLKVPIFSCFFFCSLHCIFMMLTLRSSKLSEIHSIVFSAVPLYLFIQYIYQSLQHYWQRLHIAVRPSLVPIP